MWVVILSNFFILFLPATIIHLAYCEAFVASISDIEYLVSGCVEICINILYCICFYCCCLLLVFLFNDKHSVAIGIPVSLKTRISKIVAVFYLFQVM
jgi:hypothetical protein